MKERWGEKKIDDDFGDDALPDLDAIVAKYIRAHPEEFFRSK